MFEGEELAELTCMVPVLAVGHVESAITDLHPRRLQSLKDLLREQLCESLTILEQNLISFGHLMVLPCTLTVLESFGCLRGYVHQDKAAVINHLLSLAIVLQKVSLHAELDKLEYTPEESRADEVNYDALILTQVESDLEDGSCQLEHGVEFLISEGSLGQLGLHHLHFFVPLEGNLYILAIEDEWIILVH